ncbi:MAG TPA: nuclear transport factor 2 family protein [Solirubrobacteraceae bacterium]
MSEKNKQVVQRGFEARSAGRIFDWIETLDPNIEWDISAYPVEGFPERGSGRKEFVAYVTQYWSVWNDYSQDVKEMIDAGKDVVVVLHEHARLRHSDADLERDVATVWTIENGLRVRFRAFGSRAEALRAVGLEN